MSKGKGIVKFDRSLGQFVVPAGIRQDLEKQFPGVHIDNELKKMASWLLSARGENRKGTLTFVTNWLARAAGSRTTSSNETLDLPHNSILQSYYTNYLASLWNEKEHLLALNSINR